MEKIKKIFTNIRVIILLVALVMAIVAIQPSFGRDGVAIRTVIANSSAALGGVQSPSPTARPMSRELIMSINGQQIKNSEDYFNFTASLVPNQSLAVKTNKGSYVLRAHPLLQVTFLNATEFVEVNETIESNESINGTLVSVNTTVTRQVEQQKKHVEVIGVEDLGLRVYDAPQNNLQLGLDLQGGTRVLLEPLEPLNKEDFDSLLENMKQRLNVYGLSDLVVREASDLSGNAFILVEIAGANEGEVNDLLAKQGKFEAKIGNATVFVGGKDITYVCRNPSCSYAIDPRRGCGQSGDQHFCSFAFSISMTPEAAQRQAALTNSLQVITGTGNNNRYLSKPLDLYLDDVLVDSLQISADLKGKPVTEIEISGSGSGASQRDAAVDSAKNMKRLQTILITGSLPVKLKIVRAETISPLLGKEFGKNAVLVGIVAILTVAAVLFVRYRKLAVTIPMVFTMMSEIILLLGLAALIGWQLDLVAIAGIIVAIGTGVDDQIVITEELLGNSQTALDWKERFKRAFFIIMAAYFCTVVAMVPLLFAGAGLLKMFAITTIAGVTFGVFLTRSAYAAIVTVLIKE